MDFKTIEKNYQRGIWSKQMVKNAVGRTITAEEYKTITGEVYSK